MSINKVILIGRVAAEPESRAFPNGGSICNLRVATNNRWKDRQTGEQKESAEFHRCVLRNKLGEIAQQYLHKGSQVYLEGRLQTRKWQAQDGQDRYTTEIVCNEMTMLDSKGNQSTTSQPSGNQTQPESQQAGPEYGGDSSYYDDDIPFAQHLKNTVI